MLYTISIKNLNGLNKVGQNLIDFNQVSPISVSSPETPYDSFISDTKYNLDGFVQIPLYNRQQYCNIPPNSILTITTENSTEAIYYSTIKIDGGSVTVDPDPVSGKGGGGGGGTDEFAKLLLSRNFENGTLVIPDYITELGSDSITFGNDLQLVEINVDNLTSVSTDQPYAMNIMNMPHVFESNNVGHCYFVKLNSNDWYSMDINIYRNIFPKGTTGIRKYVIPVLFTSLDFIATLMQASSINELYDQMVAALGEDSMLDFRDAGLYCAQGIGSVRIQTDISSEDLQNKYIYYNYDETNHTIRNSITSDIEYVKGESFVSIYTIDGMILEEGVILVDKNNLPEDITEMSQSDYKDIRSNFSEYSLDTYYDTGIIKDGKSVLIMMSVILDAIGNILYMPLYEQGKFYKRV